MKSKLIALRMPKKYHNLLSEIKQYFGYNTSSAVRIALRKFWLPYVEKKREEYPRKNP